MQHIKWHIQIWKNKQTNKLLTIIVFLHVCLKIKMNTVAITSCCWLRLDWQFIYLFSVSMFISVGWTGWWPASCWCKWPSKPGWRWRRALERWCERSCPLCWRDWMTFFHPPACIHHPSWAAGSLGPAGMGWRWRWMWCSWKRLSIRDLWLCLCCRWIPRCWKCCWSSWRRKPTLASVEESKWKFWTIIIKNYYILSKSETFILLMAL